MLGEIRPLGLMIKWTEMYLEAETLWDSGAIKSNDHLCLLRIGQDVTARNHEVTWEFTNRAKAERSKA